MIYASPADPPTDRARTEIGRFFDGLDFVPPYPGQRRAWCSWAVRRRP